MQQAALYNEYTMNDEERMIKERMIKGG